MLAAVVMAATAAIAAAPMRAPGPIPTYPRLTAFPDPAVKAKVNALLSAKEREDRQTRRECLAERSSSGVRGSWETATEVGYLSQRFLSVSVTSSYDCGSAYPNDGIQSPVTYDLTTGRAIDWAKLFKPGFMPSEAAGASGGTSGLAKLYRARYPKDADKDCKDAVSVDSGFGSSFMMWLERGHGLVVQPDFPHAIAVCAEMVTLPPDVLARYLRDPAVLADLRSSK